MSTGEAARATSELSLLFQYPRRPDYSPHGDTQNEWKSIEDIEPKLDSSECTIVALGEFGNSEHTSNLVISYVQVQRQEGLTIMPTADHRRA
jgi:hypothetical protein